MKYFNKILKYIKIFLILIYIIFEEILWNKIGVPVYNRIKSLDLIVKLKNYIEKIKSKYLVLALFLCVILIDNSLTIILGYCLSKGFIFFAITLYIIKALLSILTVLIFKLGKKQLIGFKIVKYGFYYILKIKYSKTLKETKQYIKSIKENIIFLKNKYFKRKGFKHIYKKLKK